MLRSFCYFTFVATALLTGSPARAQGPAPAMSAELTTTFTLPDGRSFSTVGHYYQSKDGKTREDSPMGSVIIDPVRSTVTLLKPDSKEALVIVTPGHPRVAKPANPPVFEVLEGATVDGHQVTKTRAVGSGRQTHEVWTNKALGIVEYSRMSGPDMSVTRVVRNVDLREPAASVFDIPDGYTVVHDTIRPTPAPPRK